LEIMKAQPRNPAEVANNSHDLSIPAGCIVCGGDLDVRISAPGVATSICTRCHWISRPQMHRHEDSLHFVHPAGGVA
jgi:hypothetical protein